MTVQEIIDSVKIEFDQPGSSGMFSDAQLLDLVNEGYRDFCRYTEIKEKTTTQVVAGFQGMGSLPTDFLDSRQFRWSYNLQVYPKNERTMDYVYSGWTSAVASRPNFMIYYNYNRFRLTPIPNSAGTVTFRYAYIPSNLTVSDSPSYQKMYHDALVAYVRCQCFWAAKQKDNAKKSWDEYAKIRLKAREQARVNQRTPDIMMAKQPVTVFNYPLWDSGYRQR